MGKTIIDVDTKTFIRFWLVLLSIGLIILFLYKALTGLILIGISIFLALALRPLVRKLETFLNRHFGINKNYKVTSAVTAYTLIVIFFITIIIIVGPAIVHETSKFVQQLPQTFENSIGGWDGLNKFGRSIGIHNLQNELAEKLSSFSSTLLSNLPTTVLNSLNAIGDFITKSILVLVLTLLFLLEGPTIVHATWKNFNHKKEDHLSTTTLQRTFARMCNVISIYVSRQTLIALLDGLATMVIVFTLSLIFSFSHTLAIPMGLVAFVFYLIPMFGQIITTFLISTVLAFSSPISAVVFLVVYIIYAQIENNGIAPKIQGDALKLPAVAILSAIVIGMYMFGLLGAIIAIPIAGCIRVLIEEYPNFKSSSS